MFNEYLIKLNNSDDKILYTFKYEQINTGILLSDKYNILNFLEFDSMIKNILILYIIKYYFVMSVYLLIIHYFSKIY